MGESGRARLSSDARAAVDILIRDVGGDGVGEGVDFAGEVVVISNHLCAEIANAGINLGTGIIS